MKWEVRFDFGGGCDFVVTVEGPEIVDQRSAIHSALSYVRETRPWAQYLAIKSAEQILTPAAVN